VSDQDQPGGRRRVDPDATRAVDPDATRAVDPDATRAVDPASGGGDLESTQRIDLGAGAGQTAEREPWEGTADPYDTPAGATGYLDPDGEPLEGPPDEPATDEAEGRRGRDLAFGVGGMVLGFLIAVLVIALGTSDRSPEGETAAAPERIEELEAGLADRDATIDALEAQVAEAQAAAGASDADAEAQRQALDERAQALDARVEAIDERSTALDQREAQLDERQSELDQREAELADREQQAEEPADGGEPGGGGDGDDGGEGLLPDLDTDEVETFIDRILDRIRDLF
jgi:hypothetical protein